jgi:4a-hydroxytetrahydrobiopterin dehydratase
MQDQRLDLAEISSGMAHLHAWTLDADMQSILKAWEFDSFKTAMAFFASVGELAEAHDHHPELLSNYKTMRVKLWTHTVHGLTRKDFELAMAIDQLVEKNFVQRLQQQSSTDQG